MYEVVVVHVVDRRGHLGEHPPRLPLGEGPLLSQAGEELPAGGELHREVEAGQGLGHLVQPEISNISF